MASKTMPDCLGGGIGASSPVWMRDYSQPNDREPKNPKAKSMIGKWLNEKSFLVSASANANANEYLPIQQQNITVWSLAGNIHASIHYFR